MPCLLYLPSLTEEIESLQLLRTAYPALISLADVRFADEKHHVARMEGFDKVIRYGVLKGYTHAGEHVKIAELLMIQMKDLVDKMGVEFAKHLKVRYQTSDMGCMLSS